MARIKPSVASRNRRRKILKQTKGFTGGRRRLLRTATEALHRAWAFGEALRRACDKAPERIAIVGTGGISHWPATPDSGKVNWEWDQQFMDRWCRNDRDALLSYTDAETYRDGGQGGFESRSFIAVAAAARGAGQVLYCQPIPIFAVSCTAATMEVA